MKLYRGMRRRGGTCYVTVSEDAGRPRVLPTRYGTKPGQVRHSAIGFEWGYSGAAPAQLAFVICYDVLGTDEEARAVYRAFETDVIAKLNPKQDWSLTEAELRLKLDALLRAGARGAA